MSSTAAQLVMANTMRRGSVMGGFKRALTSSQSTKPKVKYENTFRCEVKDEEKFKEEVAQRLVHSALSNYLKDEKYNPATCSRLCFTVSEIIKRRLKEENWPRYKFVVHVVIGENTDQDAFVASRQVCALGPIGGIFKQMTCCLQASVRVWFARRSIQTDDMLSPDVSGTRTLITV